MTPTSTVPHGLFPVVPTAFTDSGELDIDSQKRCLDFMIEAGSNGLFILANFSEQFLLADDERELLTGSVLEHLAGRVPMIVTTSHFSSKVCAARSRSAQDQGAAMVGAAGKLRELIRLGGASVVGPWDGEDAKTARRVDALVLRRSH